MSPRKHLKRLERELKKSRNETEELQKRFKKVVSDGMQFAAETQAIRRQVLRMI